MKQKITDRLGGNPYISLLQTAWRYAEERRGRYLFIYGLFTINNIITSLIPIIWGLFINRLQVEGTDALAAAWWYIGAYLLIHFGGWAVHFPARIMERKLAFELSSRLLRDVYHKVVRLPLPWHRDHHSGDTINRLRKAYEALKNFFDMGFSYFQTLARMLIALVAIVIFSPVFGTIAVVMGIIFVAIILYFDRPYIEASRETNERENRLTAGLFDSLSNIITVITLRLGARMEKDMAQRIEHIFPSFRRQTQINEKKWFSSSTATALMYCIIIVGYVYTYWQPGEVFLIGGLVTLVGYVNQFTGVFSNLTGQYTQIVRYHTDVGSIAPILEAYRQGHRPELTQEPIPRNWQSLTIRNLSFSYAGADDGPGLTDVNLDLGRGQRIALIGESGSGKSTILRALRGLYPTLSLDLLLDGQRLTNPALLFEQTTLIPQEPEIFEDTIRNNLTLGLPFTDESIRMALHISAFDEVVRDLPDGLQTAMTERGVNLSGGQKQRLSIARGLLAAKGSTLLLLDEPTSSMDPRKEVAIYERLFAHCADNTIVSTLHRLHLLRYFDYVYMVGKGRIIAQGSFEDLLKGQPLFQRMWQHQMQESSSFNDE